jgi:4-amino-4-deoxy-L-arabinose transferase-like glycosyltransferase
MLGFAAQRSLDRQKGERIGVLLYGVAAVAFAWTMRGTAIERPAEEGGPAHVPAPSPALLALSLGVALLGCLDFGGNQFRPLGLALWIGGLFVALRHLSQLSSEGTLGRRLRAWWKRRGAWVPVYWLVLLAIVLVGGCFRLYRLHEIPSDLGPDLIYHYYDTLDILNGQYRIHFPERESLLFYCTALCARFIGLSPFTIFFTSALIGTATIVALYALGAETFGPEVGLLAALLLAINRWHLALSRSGYPAVLTPLAAILLLYTLVRALRRQQFIDFAWCGFQLGLGFYTYTPYKAMPVFVILGLALYGLARGWAQLRPLVPRVLLLFAVAVVVATPLVRFAVENPREYFVREAVALRLKREQADQDRGLPTYLWRTMLGLNYIGDQVQRWNYPGARHMGFVSGALMVLGLAYALWRWRHGYNMLLVSAWFLLLLPAALGMLPYDSASSLRMSGMLGPAVLLAALPLPLIGRAMRQAWARRDTAGQTSTPPEGTSAREPRVFALTVDSATRHYAWKWQPQRLKRWLAATLALGVVVALLWFEVREANRFYFHDFVSHAPDRMNYSNAREVAREIEHYGDLESVYIEPWQFWFDAKALWANLRMKDQNWAPWVTTLDPGQPPLATIHGPALFILHADDQQGLATLRAFFPRGVAILHTYPDGIPSFYTFYAER